MAPVVLDRFWFPRGSDVPMNFGFLDANVGSASILSGRSQLAALLQELRDVPCLILLGEPGLGKSHEAESRMCLGRGRRISAVPR